MGLGRRLAAVALCLAAAVQTAAQAQQPKIWRIAFVNAGSPQSASDSLEALRRGLRELGYVEGRNLAIEPHWAYAERNRLASIAATVVKSRPDVIVGSGTETIAALKRETLTIPIVMASGSDPVKSGLVLSMARPGGNITGLSNMAGETTAKLVELVRELLPNATRAAFLLSGDSSSPAKWNDAESAAKRLRLRLIPVRAATAGDIDVALAVALQERPAALIVPADILFFAERRRIVEFAAKARLPAVYSRIEFVREGGLASYGLSLTDIFRRSANHVDKILKGARPGELPIEQPTTFELALNLKTVKALDLKVSRDFLARADEVIQ
jgi:putative tryptophan/tyrosine transport system substrate-binding protein